MKILQIGKLERGITLVKNVKDVRAFVDNYLDTMGAIKIGDLSLLSRAAISTFLKFIEERVQIITCYASRDNVSPVLMSRFDKVLKFDDIEFGTGPFTDFLESVELDNVRDVSMEREFLTKSGYHLDSYLIYRKLSGGIKARIGRLL